MDPEFTFMPLVPLSPDETDNPVYTVNTVLAPKNPKEFSRYVRHSIEEIMDAVKGEVVVNDVFRVNITGDLSDKFILTAQRLGRKAENQYESARNEEREIWSRLEKDYEQKSNHGNFETLFDIAIGSIIGSQMSPENPSRGAVIGGAIGFTYNPIIHYLGKVSRFITGSIYKNIRLKQRYPLAAKADDYRRFGRSIESGLIHLRD